MFIFQSVNLVYLTQPDGAEDHLLVQGDKAVDDDTTLEKSGIRNRYIETDVPPSFFDNLSPVFAEGIGTILRTGSTLSSDIQFTIKLTVVSEPSDAPSAPPSYNPTAKGPTKRPTLSPSMSPTEEQTIGMTYCPCDMQNQCLDQPVTLDVTESTMRICLTASPSTAEMEVPLVQVKDKSVPLETQITGNTAVVTGNLSEDDFDTDEPVDLVVLGKADQVCLLFDLL